MGFQYQIKTFCGLEMGKDGKIIFLSIRENSIEFIDKYYNDPERHNTYLSPIFKTRERCERELKSLNKAIIFPNGSLILGENIIEVDIISKITNCDKLQKDIITFTVEDRIISNFGNTKEKIIELTWNDFSKDVLEFDDEIIEAYKHRHHHRK